MIIIKWQKKPQNILQLYTLQTLTYSIKGLKQKLVIFLLLFKCMKFTVFFSHI